MIYMIRAIGTGYVKIGKAGGLDIEPRLIQLQVGCPFELRVIARVVDWPDYMESVLHRHLHRDSIRGEWFKLGERTRQVLRIMQNGGTGWKAHLETLRENGQRSRLKAVVNYAHEMVR